MAALFCDSFDHYATANVLQKWNSGGASIVSTVSRTGPQSCFFDGAGGLFLTIDNAYGHTLIMGTAVRMGLFGTNVMGLSTGQQLPFGKCSIDVTGAGLVKFVVHARGDVPELVAPASSALHENVWYRIEMKILCKADATGTVEIRINGVAVIQATNVVTVNTTEDPTDSFCIGGPGGAGQTYHDDVYLCDSTGLHNNDFLGDVIVVEQVPNANGHYTEWTPSTGVDHAALVNTIPPDTTKYNSSNTNGQRDTYTYPAPSIVLPATIPFRQALHYAEKDIAGTRLMAPLLRQGGSDYLSLVNQAPSLNSYFFGRQVFDQNPVTSADWNSNDLTLCEMGQEITG